MGKIKEKIKKQIDVGLIEGGLITVMLIMLVPSFCFGEDFHWVDEKGNEVSDEKVTEFVDNIFTDSINKQAEENIPILNKLKTCKPIEGQHMQVIGKESDLCHFKYADYDCHFPQEIAKEYAELGIKVCQEILKGNFNTEATENVRMNEILSNENYCSSETTWTVTMEDEDGNEVPMEGITIE